ncbi:MAG: hypothetical protein ABWJ99_05435 [Caldimicrobium sp.]
MFYYPLKKLFYPLKQEIRIPEEHRQFIHSLRQYERIPDKKIESIKIAKNPFYEETSKKIGGTLLPETLILTSIFKDNKRGCIINGKLYQEGDKIGKIKISKIGDYYVELLLPKGKKIKLEVGAVFTLSSYN